MNLLLWIILAICTTVNLFAGLWFIRAVSGEVGMAGAQASKAVALWYFASGAAVFVCGLLTGQAW
jgi:hypothetical protein